jgi:hypothetical protein
VLDCVSTTLAAGETVLRTLVGMSKSVDPGSRAGRLLALLKSTPDEAWETAALADALGLQSNQVAQALIGATRGCAENSPWQHVQRQSRGVWIYRSSSIVQPLGWEPLGEDGPTLVVLRGPDGRLWVAKPLSGCATA